MKRPREDTALADVRVDLAASRLGGLVLAANDEFFAPKETLLRPHPPAFDPNAYGDRGKVMDGWETRRRRDSGHDWCVVRLGVPGILREAIVDTSNFRGNHAEACSLEGCSVEADDVGNADWSALSDTVALAGDSLNRLALEAPYRVTHVRLNIFPDGGVARLRLLGAPVADLRADTGTIDLASVLQGGAAVAYSDDFFASAQNLVAPGDSTHMGDGWETRRRRTPGEDWVVVALAAEGVVERVELDTTHFKGNFPDRCAIDGCATEAGSDPAHDTAWRSLVEPTAMRPHARHRLAVDDADPVTHVRLRVLPDGGVARMRVIGSLSAAGRRQVGLRWFNTLLPSEAATALADCCAAAEWVKAMEAARPFSDVETLMRRADEMWENLDAEGWKEAFAAHPRIGQRSAGPWSQQEQAGTGSASAETLSALDEGNRTYEERFGHVFLICATGKSAEEMRTALESRLANDADTELQVAAEEHRKITRLRLGKLLGV